MFARNGFLAVSVFLTTLSSCVVNENVEDIPSNRESYIDKIVSVNGTLRNYESVLSLCTDSVNDSCLPLEIKSEDYDAISHSLGIKVVIKGVYLDHDYKEVNGNLAFIPSRILVNSYIVLEKTN